MNIQDIKWGVLYKEFPEDRDDMSREREVEFINRCFDIYESEGFSKVFRSHCGDFAERNGQSFDVVRRIEATEDADIECLPMWEIRFDDGEVLNAYPEEIIPSEIARNGY